MGLKEKLHRLIADALAVWRVKGANRPFTRRGMTEDDLLKESKDSQAAEQPTEGKKPQG